jgi:hypothetical protein
MPRRIHHFSISALSVMLALLFLLAGCSNNYFNKPLPPGAPPVPTAADPWFGTLGNVLISDRDQNSGGPINYLWIGFNSQANWQNFLSLSRNLSNGGYWIGGKVVVALSNPLGFYFDPSTASAAEATVEGEQTNLSMIKADPSQFANNPLPQIVVPAVVEAIR